MNSIIFHYGFDLQKVFVGVVTNNLHLQQTKF
jgi:hypothetical protein